MRWLFPAGIAAAAVIALSAGTPGPVAGGERALAASGYGQRCPRGDENGLRVRRLVGKRLARARRIADRKGCTVRVVKRNGRDLVVTDDYVSNRVNVAVRHRRVTGVRGVY